MKALASPLQRVLTQHLTTPIATRLLCSYRPAAANASSILPALAFSRPPAAAAKALRQSQHRGFTSSVILRAVQKSAEKATQTEPLSVQTQDHEFGRTEKASKAAEINLSAKLHKEGLAGGTKPGLGEIVRLLKIARPEAKWLGGTLEAGMDDRAGWC